MYNIYNKKIGVVLGIFDIITSEISDKIRKVSEKSEVLAIGVYSDKYVEGKNGICLKTVEQRMAIADQMADFTFVIESDDECEISKNLLKAYNKFLLNKKIPTCSKYKVGIIIGSFDLLHSGHIEHILRTKEHADKIVVFVKTDERIVKKKKVIPIQDTHKRAIALQTLVPVDGVFLYDEDMCKKDVIKEVMSLYKVGLNEIVFSGGEDLKAKDENNANKLGVDFIFTTRGNMNVVSTSHYKRICREKNWDVKDLERFNNEHVRIM